MLSGEFAASETTESVPLTEPEPVGANVAVNVTLWFGVRVIGNVNPLIEKAAPDILACEIVTEELPVLVNVSDKFVLLPTWTLPNARLVGFAERVEAVKVTVIAALADLVLSATLVAVSVTVVPLVTTGAVNNPELLTVPAETVHVTDWLLLLMT